MKITGQIDGAAGNIRGSLRALKYHTPTAATRKAPRGGRQVINNPVVWPVGERGAERRVRAHNAPSFCSQSATRTPRIVAFTRSAVGRTCERSEWKCAFCDGGPIRRRLRPTARRRSKGGARLREGFESNALYLIGPLKGGQALNTNPTHTHTHTQSSEAELHSLRWPPGGDLSRCKRRQSARIFLLVIPAVNVVFNAA